MTIYSSMCSEGDPVILCFSGDSFDKLIGFWSCSEILRRFVAVLVANAVRRFVPDLEMSVTGPKTDKKIRENAASLWCEYTYSEYVSCMYC